MKNSILYILFIIIIISTVLPVARKQEIERISKLWNIN